MASSMQREEHDLESENKAEDKQGIPGMSNKANPPIEVLDLSMEGNSQPHKAHSTTGTSNKGDIKQKDDTKTEKCGDGK